MNSRLKFHIESMPKVINENLVSVKSKVRDVFLDKPLAVGFSVLDLSKLIMGEFWYQVLIPKFGFDRIQLLYTDTDSFYVQFFDWSYNEVLNKLESHIDFSNFPPQHPRFDSAKKAMFGYVKCDTGAKCIHAFLGEKKKSYQLFMNDSLNEVRDIYGMERKTVKKGCQHKSAEEIKTVQLLNLIRSPGIIKAPYTKLQSKNHTINMIGGTKTVSSSFDNSAFYRSCNLCNVPFSCTLKDIKKCDSIDCDLSKLCVDIWHRLISE